MLLELELNTFPIEMAENVMLATVDRNRAKSAPGAVET